MNTEDLLASKIRKRLAKLLKELLQDSDRCSSFDWNGRLVTVTEESLRPALLSLLWSWNTVIRFSFFANVCSCFDAEDQEIFLEILLKNNPEKSPIFHTAVNFEHKGKLCLLI